VSASGAMPSQFGFQAAACAGLVQLAQSAVPSGDPWYPYSSKHWALDVTNANYICKEGTEQSPIDFPECDSPLVRSEPTITWQTKPAQLANNGHTVQLTPKDDGNSNGKMVYPIAGITKAYTLVQCHFHYGSEHQVGSRQFPFETHCVHTLDGSDQAQRYGVFGAFFTIDNAGGGSSFLAQFEDDLPTKPTRRLRGAGEGVSFNVHGEPLSNVTKRRLAESNVQTSFTSPVNFMKLVDDIKASTGMSFGAPPMQHYWNYDGSFTTPPCTEAVDFYIYMVPVQMTQDQLNKFMVTIDWGNFNAGGGNFRPPQPLKTRSIYGCSMEPPALEDGHWYPYEASNWADAVGLNSHRVCDGGSEQSPIDFAACLKAEDQTAIEISWTSNNAVTMSNNGHTVVINVDKTANGNSVNSGEMTAHGKAYRLLQCHFHWGSEHTVGGIQYPFEVHCVHQKSITLGTEAPHYGVFGQFYEMGDTPNAWLTTLEDKLPSARRLSETSEIQVVAPKLNLFGQPMDRRLAGGGGVEEKMSTFDFKGLYGDNKLSQFWNYGGSFTTPPCTEAVDFYIMMQPAVMTTAQLAKFKVAIGWTTAGGNFRPPQPLGSRVVSGCARIATIVNMMNSQNTNLESSIKQMIEESVSTQMANTLNDEQGAHGSMLIVLVVLGVLMMVVSLAVLGMTIEVVKRKQPAGSSVPAQSVGNGVQGSTCTSHTEAPTEL